MRPTIKRHLSNSEKEVEKALQLHDDDTYMYGRLLSIAQQIEGLKYELEIQDIKEETQWNH